jgi:glutathione S-transferase
MSRRSDRRQLHLPYVRKVLAVLASEGHRLSDRPIVPFFGNDRFSEISPLRRIPCIRDGKVTLCDSTVICEYLEDRHPDAALYPREPPTARARAGSRSSPTRAWAR